ncbi:hypothetical protein [Stakelama pacifica]|uniref:Phage shock protein B n=1 Tax=Stakelama pacifica TaxID=517720 RepID=A0A4R6FF46_9SPHN|nr:hypothetical protein [Stakelama pacifica]MAX01157.1 hypothetical protein [Sphingomonas sp.]TDN79911.1 hypothetical protein EV664_11168 [Stakelama pacifica]GGO98188.1 hypothetical protein GCM10011329_28760 [Stakelama pacifica]
MISPILVPLFGISIPLVALIAKLIIQPWLEHKQKAMELESRMIAEKSAQYAAQTERLEQRVRVLERIVTDRGMDIADEIEKLRDTPLN